MLNHGHGAVLANVADGDAQFARSFEIDVVGAGRGEADEAQARHGAHARARDVQLVGEDEFHAGNAFIDLRVGGGGVQRDARQHPFELRGVEVVVTDGSEIQKYRSHPVP